MKVIDVPQACQDALLMLGKKGLKLIENSEFGHNLFPQLSQPYSGWRGTLCPLPVGFCLAVPKRLIVG